MSIEINENNIFLNQYFLKVAIFKKITFFDRSRFDFLIKIDDVKHFHILIKIIKLRLIKRSKF